VISIVIPIYNEENSLRENALHFQTLSQKAELIFVDAASTDQSIALAKQYGRVLQSKKGRGRQMNYGADFAQADILFFMHADSFIDRQALYAIQNRINREDIAGGCLTQEINKKGIIFRILEAQGNLRARISRVFYGDQGIFVKKDIFFGLGGFPQVPVLEDVLFSKKLRQAGKTAVLANKIFTSPRRWERQGIIKATLTYCLISQLFRFGYPLEKISRLYDDLR